MSFTQVATSIASAQLLKRAKYAWFGYGVAAYAGLKVMKKFGIFEKQADQALNVIDQALGRTPKDVTPSAPAKTNA